MEKVKGRVAHRGCWGMDAPGRVYLHFNVDAYLYYFSLVTSCEEKRERDRDND